MEPAIRTNTAQERRLVLKASLRPMMSAEKPQMPAPTRRPICEAIGMPEILGLGRPYSRCTAGLAMDWQTTRSWILEC
jgi:hypothetical protein